MLKDPTETHKVGKILALIPGLKLTALVQLQTLPREHCRSAVGVIAAESLVLVIV